MIIYIYVAYTMAGMLQPPSCCCFL